MWFSFKLARQLNTALLSLSWFIGKALKWSCKGSHYVQLYNERKVPSCSLEWTDAWLGAMAFISIALATDYALIQLLAETRRQDWRLCTKTTRRGYQLHLWSVDSSHVELAVRQFMFGRWLLAFWRTSQMLRLYAPAPAMDPTINVQAPISVWANSAFRTAHHRPALLKYACQ